MPFALLMFVIFVYGVGVLVAAGLYVNEFGPRPNDILETVAAGFFGLLGGLLWPIILPCFLFGWLVERVFG